MTEEDSEKQILILSSNYATVECLWLTPSLETPNDFRLSLGITKDYEHEH
jgi:hypothetical protein